MTAEGKCIVLGLFMFYSMHSLANMHSTGTNTVIIHVVRRIQKEVFVVCVQILFQQLCGSTRDSCEKLVYIVEILCLWTLSIVLSLSKNCPVYFSKHNVSETGFCLRR
jgi:hypothetical protein